MTDPCPIATAQVGSGGHKTVRYFATTRHSNHLLPMAAAIGREVPEPAAATERASAIRS
jgi:hypothetical protein